MEEPDDSQDGPALTLPTARERQRPTPQPRTSKSAKLEPGSSLGKYTIVKHLGEGGMGAVYEAVNTKIGKSVALKVLSGELAEDAKAQARFLREAAAVCKLQDNHVVNVMDYAADQGVPYIVMELLRGEDLADYLDKHPSGLAVEEAVDFHLAICAGVYAAHLAGIIHRDLKPRNIFLARTTRDLDPKVLDFGISKVEDTDVDASLTKTGAVLGTTHYMSPEQVVGKRVDARTDQYSLGVVLYECLTGRRPHEGDTVYMVIKSICEGKVVPPSVLRPDLPAELERVILRAMAREPDERFPSVHALGAALLPFASPKKRIQWVDYYGREASAAGDDRGPEPLTPASRRSAGLDGTPAMPKTIKLDESGMQVSARGNREVPLARTMKLPDDHRVRPPASEGGGEARWGSSGSAAAIDPQPSKSPVVRSEARTLPRRSRTGWVFAVGIAGCAVGAALLFLWNGYRDASNRSAAMAHDRAASPSAADEVTIDIADAPPGLVAIIDGKEAGIPLRLPRGPHAREVEFHAPGYESKQIGLDVREDRTLRLEMRKRPVEDRVQPEEGSKSGGGGPGKRNHRSPQRRDRSGAPRPFNDI